MNKMQLINFRELIGLNKTDMAHYLGVPLNTYLQWERGDRELSSAPKRLIEVLNQVKELCPELHQNLINKKDIELPKISSSQRISINLIGDNGDSMSLTLKEAKDLYGQLQVIFESNN